MERKQRPIRNRIVRRSEQRISNPCPATGGRHQLGKQALETGEIGVVIQDAAVAVTDILNNDYPEVLELLPGGNGIFSDMVSAGRTGTEARQRSTRTGSINHDSATSAETWRR